MNTTEKLNAYGVDVEMWKNNTFKTISSEQKELVTRFFAESGESVNSVAGALGKPHPTISKLVKKAPADEPKGVDVEQLKRIVELLKEHHKEVFEDVTDRLVNEQIEKEKEAIRKRVISNLL